MLAPWKKSYEKPRQCIKKQRCYFANKVLYSQSYGFSSSHVWMWELDHKEGWASKNWCFLTMVLEKILESPLDCKEIKPVNPKGNQSWIFTGRTDTEAETPTFWPPDVKNQLTGTTLMLEKNWRQVEKGMAEDEMVGWHHWLNGHEFEQALGDGEGHGVSKSWTQLSHFHFHFALWYSWEWASHSFILASRKKEQLLSVACWLYGRWEQPEDRISGIDCLTIHKCT